MNKETIKTKDAKLTIYWDGPQWNGDTSVAFGEFSCNDENSGYEILTAAILKVKAKGITHIIGPMDGNTWHNYRFVIETNDTPPFLLEPTYRPHELAAFNKIGFHTISHYFSSKTLLSEKGQPKTSSNAGITIESWNGQEAELLFEKVHNLSTTAFSDNAFYTPISKTEFLEIYMPIVPMLKKELIFFAYDEHKKLVGFLFGIPNYAEGPEPESVILKTYASLKKGAGYALSEAFHKTAYELKYKTVIHALMHSDNLSMQRSNAEGGEIFRRYALFGLILNE